MPWLLFSTEAEAAEAEAKASDNVRRFVRIVAPERIAEDGSILGIDAASWQPQPAAARTERWAIPEHAATGWAMPMPTPEQIAPVPLGVFLMGVGGEEVESLPQLEGPTPWPPRPREDCSNTQ